MCGGFFRYIWKEVKRMSAEGYRNYVDYDDGARRGNGRRRGRVRAGGSMSGS